MLSQSEFNNILKKKNIVIGNDEHLELLREFTDILSNKILDEWKQNYENREQETKNSTSISKN